MIQKQQNEVLGHPLPISTYLLKPFQRILKYPELLKVNLFSSQNGWFFRTRRPVFGPRIPKLGNMTLKTEDLEQSPIVTWKTVYNWSPSNGYFFPKSSRFFKKATLWKLGRQGLNCYGNNELETWELYLTWYFWSCRVINIPLYDHYLYETTTLQLLWAPYTSFQS